MLSLAAKAIPGCGFRAFLRFYQDASRTRQFIGCKNTISIVLAHGTRKKIFGLNIHGLPSVLRERSKEADEFKNFLRRDQTKEGDLLLKELEEKVPRWVKMIASNDPVFLNLIVIALQKKVPVLDKISSRSSSSSV